MVCVVRGSVDARRDNAVFDGREEVEAMDFLIKFIKAILTWLFDFVTWGLEQCWNLLCIGLAAVLNAIPVPSWLVSAPSVIGSMPSGVAYVLGAFRVGDGLTILLAAYTLRFVIRRIPLIG